MATQSGSGGKTPAREPIRDPASCGKVVGHDGDRILSCALPAGHEDATPCRVSVHDIKAINRRVIEQFRSGDDIDDFDRRGLLLLTTVGARTGTPHTTPMGFYVDDERLLVVASALGAHEHPHWYVNLVANAQVTVEVSDDRYQALAAPLPAEEREQAWGRLLIAAPFLVDHQANTTRTIPVVAITRAKGR